MKLSRRSFMKAAAVAGVAAATGSMTACSDEVITLTYSEVNPETTIVGKIGAAFKEKLEELSEGAVMVDAQFSGVLGSETDVLDLMLGGDTSIDVARISAFALTSYGVTKVNVLALPFVFESREHFWNFAASDVAADVKEETAEIGLGVSTLMFGEEGFRHFFSSWELNSMDDLVGQKIRVSNDTIMNGLVEAIGATPCVVDWSELYSGLDTGVCDGAEQPIVNYEANSFQEVAPYLILDGHTLGAVQIIIADSAKAKLSDDQYAMVEAAAVYAGEMNAAVAEDDEAAVLAGLIADGYYVIDGVDKDALVTAVAGVVESNLADANSQTVYDAIRALL
ncbi:MAG: TRAP transporter substrate-binding protein [Faecalibacterium sp.]